MNEQSFEWSMDELCKLLSDTAETDKDNIIPIDGLTGSGKSTLALKLCMKGCPWFDMNKDILYSRKEIIDWIINAKPGSWGIADEAVNALFKRDFQRGDQKFILKLMDMCRDRNLTLFLCIPNFWALDKHMLEGRVRLRIHVARTGLSFMWVPSNNPFAPDRWYRKYNEVVCRNWDNYPNAKKTKGFVGVLSFGDLPVRQKEEYLSIKARKKAEVSKLEDEEERKEEIAKKRSVELGKMIMIDFFYTKGVLKLGWQKVLAEAEGITQEAIHARLKNFRKDGKIVNTESKLYNHNILYNNKVESNEFNVTQEEATS